MHKVLIVDDEVLVRVGLKTTIDWEEIGFTIVSEASNGEQGYENYLKHKPDVIITDIKMPKQDGLWLVEKIRKDSPDAQILVLTCYDEFSYARKALKVGADDYILKSEVEDEELVKLMSAIKNKLDVLSKARSAKDSHLASQVDVRLSIFSDLINRGFLMDERLLKVLEELDFPISDSGFAFISMSLLHDMGLQTDIKKVSDAVMNILFEQFNQNKIAYIEGQLNDTVLLFLSSPGLNAGEIKKMLTFAVNGARQYFDFTLNAVYSHVFEKIEQSKTVYSDFTEKAQVLFYPWRTGNLIRPMNIVYFAEPNVIELKKAYNRDFVEIVGHEDLNGALEMIAGFQKRFEQQIVSPMIVKIFYSNLIGDLFGSYGVFLSNREIFDTHEAYHYQIINSGRLEHIQKLLTDFTDQLIKEIQNIRYNNSKFMINQALNYIEYHYSEDISLDDVAKEMNLSKHYLCSIFKKETGENMSLYINKLRIEKAKLLLLESDVKIKDIYERVGYNNQQYFSKIFKKITGKTVNEYKEGLGSK